VSAGSPILLKYGSHDNANLLLSYGFVLPDNPADSYAWPLDMELLLVRLTCVTCDDWTFKTLQSCVNPHYQSMSPM
jgi:hypothetical protein